MAGNFEERIATPLKIANGPLPGERLLQSFKAAMIQENIFRLMFGDLGQRIFENKRPNLNETILPFILLAWRSETYSSNDTYLDGTVDMFLALPTKLMGDYNGQRRVANLIQRWMGGGMRLWDENPGLVRFGYGGEWSYADLLVQDGVSAPLITAQLPYRFDLQYMARLVDGFDPNRPLDDSDVGFIQNIGIEITNAETKDTLTEVQIATGQTNPGLGQ